MSNWPNRPLIYEINTWVWLNDLSVAARTPITLAQVPEQEWDSIRDLGFDAVWLMGVWERSPAGVAIAHRNAELLAGFRNALPDLADDDIIGSAYCIPRYVADQRIGGTAGLVEARRQLARRGLRLILDFVPNHVAPDHAWTLEHPEYFIQGSADDLRDNPNEFLEIGGRVIACGKDPYFPAWPDVAQLNAFHPDLRRSALETVIDIAKQCDGIRCDMAMLVMNDVFERTWGMRAGAPPKSEYWPDLIEAVKRVDPDFLFIAEAYWDLEWRLQEQGFDYCYDKRLYDRLEHGSAEDVRLHLLADLRYQDKLVRFIENHDEQRAASVFSTGRQWAAAVAALTLPGAKLIHEGQLDARRVRSPVFLGRRTQEAGDESLAFYHRLLQVLRCDVIRNGEWMCCARSGWPDNQSHLNLVAWTWRRDAARLLVVVNLSNSRSQGLVRVHWPDIRGRICCLHDVLTGEQFVRDGSAMIDPGLFVDLAGWGTHSLSCTDAPEY